MPYIVTTKRPAEFRGIWSLDAVSRRAVATLEEAQAEVAGLIDTQPGDTEDAFFASALLPASGGTVGPLPDGTVIEVEGIGRARLVQECIGSDAWGTRQLCDAYNARQS